MPDLHDHLSAQGYAPRTQEAYAGIAQRIEGDPVAWFCAQVAQRKPTNTLLVERAAAKALLIAEGMDPAEAAARLAQAKGTPARERAPLTDAQVVRLAEMLPVVTGPSRKIIPLLLQTGLRISEACGLRGEHVVQQGDHRTLRFPGKRGRWRDVPLNARADGLVPSGRGDGEPLYPGRRGRPITPAAVRKWTRAIAAEEESLEGLSPHVLRHTFATRLLRRGVSLPVLQRLLGHTSIKTTVRYTHPIAQDLIEAVTTLDLA